LCPACVLCAAVARLGKAWECLWSAAAIWSRQAVHPSASIAARCRHRCASSSGGFYGSTHNALCRRRAVWCSLQAVHPSASTAAKCRHRCASSSCEVMVAHTMHCTGGMQCGAACRLCIHLHLPQQRQDAHTGAGKIGLIQGEDAIVFNVTHWRCCVGCDSSCVNLHSAA
jgi:hypothetical protein